MAGTKISRVETLSYALGSFGINLQFGLVSAFLLYFYTDVYQVEAAAVAQLFLIARALDAVADPIVGLAIDRTETKWGKHRPYFVILAIPYVLLGVALFSAPELSADMKLVYIYTVYTLFGIVYSGLALPLLSMLPTLTKNLRERNFINSAREFLGTGSVVGVGVLALPLVAYLGNGSEQLGFQLTAIIFGAISLICLFLLATQTRERVQPKNADRLKTAQSFAALKKNWPWLATALLGFFNWVGFASHLQSTIYYAEYVLGDRSVMPTLMLTLFAALPGAAAAGWLANNFGKKPSAIMGCLLAAFATALTPLFDDLGWLLAMSSLTYLGVGVMGTMSFTMMADAVDYGEWRSGFRAQGFLFAASAFGVKLGMSIGGAFGAALLAWAGYRSGAQPTQAIHDAISWGFIWMPAATFLVAAVSTLFFVFDHAYLDEARTADA